jgi:FeS assembly SUF system protein
MPVNHERVMEALGRCYDPEIPVNIVELGLIYDVDVRSDDTVHIKMTLTSQGCPSAAAIPEQVKEKVGTVAEVRGVSVEVVWDPPWDPSRITPEGRQKLGIEV